MFDFSPRDSSGCDDKRLLIQAEIDGELGAADAASLAAHVAECPDCADVRARLIEVSAALKQVPRFATSAEMRDEIERSIAAATPVALPARRQFRARDASWFAGGALAAGLALLLLAGPPGDAGIAGMIVSDHIRALQPGHLTDVVSEDRHTVRPWFDGRLDFAPPVRDLAAAGFPLAGGRLDAVAGHVAAALVYRRDRHVINLFTWPDAARGDATPAFTSQGGYSLVHWREGGMAFWAVSDVEAEQLRSFVSLWRATG